MFAIPKIRQTFGTTYSQTAGRFRIGPPLVSKFEDSVGIKGFGDVEAAGILQRDVLECFVKRLEIKRMNRFLTILCGNVPKRDAAIESSGLFAGNASADS